MRKYLNLGHTFGHAVEYKTKIPHGHVMIGIIYQFIVANILPIHNSTSRIMLTI